MRLECQDEAGASRFQPGSYRRFSWARYLASSKKLQLSLSPHFSSCAAIQTRRLHFYVWNSTGPPILRCSTPINDRTAAPFSSTDASTLIPLPTPTTPTSSTQHSSEPSDGLRPVIPTPCRSTLELRVLPTLHPHRQRLQREDSSAPAHLHSRSAHPLVEAQVRPVPEVVFSVNKQVASQPAVCLAAPLALPLRLEEACLDRTTRRLPAAAAVGFSETQHSPALLLLRPRPQETCLAPRQLPQQRPSQRPRLGGCSVTQQQQPEPVEVVVCLEGV